MPSCVWGIPRIGDDGWTAGEQSEEEINWMVIRAVT